MVAFSSAGFLSYHGQRQVVDEHHDIGPARVAVLDHRKLVDGRPRICVRLIEVDGAHLGAADVTAGGSMLDGHPVHQHPMEGSVAGFQRRAFRPSQLAQRVVKRLLRQVRIEPFNSAAHGARRHDVRVALAESMGSGRLVGAADHMVAERPKPIERGILHHRLGEHRHQLHQRGKRLDPREPRPEVAALVADTVQSDARGKGWTVTHLVVPGKPLQQRRRMRVRAIVDVFRARGAAPGRCKLRRPPRPLGSLTGNLRRVREQQSLELIRLYVRHEPVGAASRGAHDLPMQRRLDGRCTVQGIRWRTGESRKVRRKPVEIEERRDVGIHSLPQSIAQEPKYPLSAQRAASPLGRRRDQSRFDEHVRVREFRTENLHHEIPLGPTFADTPYPGLFVLQPESWLN